MPLVLSVSAPKSDGQQGQYVLITCIELTLRLPASIHTPTVDVWAYGECSVAIYIVLHQYRSTDLLVCEISGSVQ